MHVTGQFNSMTPVQALTRRKARSFTSYGDLGKRSMHLIWQSAWILMPVTPHKQKADMLADWGRYDDALAVYDHVIHLDPYDFHAYRGKAKLLARIQRDEDALVVYDHYIERHPR